MKAYLLRRPGPPSVLSLQEVPHPGPPPPGHFLLRIHKIGLNYAEVLSRKGQYSWAPPRPYIPGMETLATIEACGPHTDTTRLGSLVISGMQYGAYAEYVHVPHFMALPAFPHFTPQENTAILVNFMTAWIALFKQARVQPGETVLVQAAAGGVGSAAVKLLKAHGCTVIGLAGGPHKVALVQSLGADLAIDYTQTHFDQHILQQGLRPDLVLELVGGDIFRKSYNLLKPFGRIAVAGYASIPLHKWNPLTWWPAWRDAPRAATMDMARRSIGLFATHIGYLIQDPQLIHTAFNEMADFVRHHQIRPLLGQEFPFTDLPAAHQFMESRHSTGKVTIHVSDPS